MCVNAVVRLPMWVQCFIDAPVRKRMAMTGWCGNSATVSPELLRDCKFTGIGIIVRATIRANHVASHGLFRDRCSWMPMGVFVCTSEGKDRSWGGSRSRGVRTEAAVAVFSPVAINMPLWRNRTLNTGCEGIK